MRALVKNNKGFTTLEVIVVLCIIGIISAISYPALDSWNKGREVKSDMLKAVGIFDNINSQVQRGLYSYVQVLIISSENKLKIISRGMSADTLGDKISTDGDFRKASERCYLDDDKWDDDGQTAQRPEVGMVELDDITTDFSGNEAICFSKDGRWYSTSEHFDGENSLLLYGEGGFCDDHLDPQNTKAVEKGPQCEYRIAWSRFGNIKLEKWNERKKISEDETGGWIAQ
tara:strand:- start:1989 stop:2675 length:687 start_codon:yes stop_codon:yes gene_type:complete